jgi:hypothetical protein
MADNGNEQPYDVAYTDVMNYVSWLTRDLHVSRKAYLKEQTLHYEDVRWVRISSHSFPVIACFESLQACL